MVIAQHSVQTHKRSMGFEGLLYAKQWASVEVLGGAAVQQF